MPEIKNFPTLCRNLAVEMTARTGELWQTIEHPERWTHIESQTACLTLRDDWRTHRLVIHATAPHKMKEKTTGESTTCNPSRTVEDIAKDICNRILKHAREHLKESIQWDAEQTRQANKRKLTNKFISGYLPKEYQTGCFCTDKDRSGERIKAKLTYDNLINIEINLPLPEALKLLKQLTKG